MDELERIKREKIKKIMEMQKYPDKPIDVCDSDFTSKISKYPVVVIDCWADWCGPCKMMAPVLDELARKYRGKVVFGKLDVSVNQAVPKKFGVRGIPTLLFFKDGELVDRIVGLQPKSSLESKLNSILGG